MNGENLEKLRELYASSPTAKALLNSFASRERNSTESRVERLVTVLSWSNPETTRGELIGVLKQLEALGYCEFIVGRKGHESRAEWKVGITSLGQAASGQRGDLEEFGEIVVE